MTRATVDLSRINDNYSCLSKGKTVYAVLKSDAYGHGLARVASVLYEGGARHFAVSEACDALYLTHLAEEASVLLLMPPPREALGALLSAGVILPIASQADAEAILWAAEGTRKQARVHLVLNSGMNRIGFSLHEAHLAPTLLTLRRLLLTPKLSVEGAFTHLGEPPDRPRSRSQLRRFYAAAEELYRCDASLVFHVAATSALRLSPPPMLSGLRFALRAGLSLYGYGAEGVRPAMTLEARVIGRYRVMGGEGVGYGPTPPLRKETETAAVAIGYADGLPRLSGGAFFLDRDGRRLSILGRVSMNQTVVAIGDSRIENGELVTVLDAEGRIMPRLSRAADCIPYELLLMGRCASRRYKE